MASDESMIKYDDDDDDDPYHLYNNHYDGGMEMFVSRLSIESCEADAEEELCQGRKVTVLSSDSEEEQGCYSLPATPPQWRRHKLIGVKECASDNEAPRRKNLRRTRRIRSARPGKENKTEKKEEDEEEVGGRSGESESAGAGLMVITRPKGGRRSLCMGLEEVKACKDLGFELEPMDFCISVSGSNSSGGDSPRANWRISSPGDNPRDVKARLKIWAQAVALASTSQRPTPHVTENI